MKKSYTQPVTMINTWGQLVDAIGARRCHTAQVLRVVRDIADYIALGGMDEAIEATEYLAENYAECYVALVPSTEVPALLASSSDGTFLLSLARPQRLERWLESYMD